MRPLPKNAICATRPGEEGIALVLATVLVAVALMTVGVLCNFLVGEVRHVNMFTDRERCFQALENAIYLSRAELEAGEDGAIGLDSWLEENQRGAGAGVRWPAFGDTGLSPLQLDSMANTEGGGRDPAEVRGGGRDPAEVFALAEAYPFSSADIGTPLEPGIKKTRQLYVIRVGARCAKLVRRAEAVVRGTDAGVWNNALFAGTGFGMGVVSGPAELCGSVHILGDATASEGVTPPTCVLDLSEGGIYNTWRDIPKEMAVLVMPPQSGWVSGEEVRSLDAVFRVRNGLVRMSEDACVGLPHVPGNGDKETLAGVYTGTRWMSEGTLSEEKDVLATKIHSDNGWNQDYDLDRETAFPRLDDTWNNPHTGKEVWDAERNQPYTYQRYFEEVLAGAPDDPDDGIYEGDLVINADGPALCWNAWTGAVAQGVNENLMPGSETDFLQYDPATRVLTVNGHLVVRGNLVFEQGREPAAIRYAGRGIVLVEGNAILNSDLLPRAAHGMGPVFPKMNFLGIVSSDTMLIGTKAPVRLVGAFYAQNRMIFVEHAVVLGTVVSNFFDMGRQVPMIGQIPEWVEHLPEGLPGARRVWKIVPVIWREV